MPRIVKQPDIVQTLLDLQRRIKVLENGPRLTASALRTNGNSRLQIVDVNGNIVAQFGDVAGSTPGTVLSGVVAYRSTNGRAGLNAVSNSVTGVQQFAFADSTLNQAVISTNETDGYGIEDPSIPITFYPNANIPSTSSGTPVLLWLGNLNCTHSRVDVTVQAAVSGGATASVSLVVNGVTIGTQPVAGAGFATYTFSNLPIPNTGVKTNLPVTVNGVITGGAGTLQVLLQHGRLRGALG